MTIHGFRGHIKGNNLKNPAQNYLKIQPYIDAIALRSSPGYVTLALQIPEVISALLRSAHLRR